MIEFIFFNGSVRIFTKGKKTGIMDELSLLLHSVPLHVLFETPTFYEYVIIFLQKKTFLVLWLFLRHYVDKSLGVQFEEERVFCAGENRCDISRA